MVMEELVFNCLYILEDVVVLKELNFNSLHFWRVWLSSKN